MSINPQLQSRFFAVPAEIHDAIFAYLIRDYIHLSLYKNSFRLSKCVHRDEDSDPNCFNRIIKDNRFITKPRSSNSACVRRLRSSWGSHWRCEENRITNDLAMPLLLVCKRMSTEFAERIVDTAAIRIHDLDTLRILVADLECNRTKSGQSYVSSLLGRVLLNVKDLSISLRLPLAAYEALGATTQSSVGPSLLSPWAGIERFGRLRKLRIWLDHDEPCSWSMVNERAILSPLASLNTNLNISIDLPKLHPKWERPDWHFTKDSPQLPVFLHRRYRQRYHVVECSDGSLSILLKPDFPISFELTGWDMTMEQIEDYERTSWKAGRNPFQDLIDLEPSGHPW